MARGRMTRGSTAPGSGPTLGRDLRLIAVSTALLSGAAVMVGCGSDEPPATPEPPAPAAAPNPHSAGGPAPRPAADPSPDPAAEREPARARGVVTTLHRYSQAVQARDPGAIEPLLTRSVRRRRPAASRCVESFGRPGVAADFAAEFAKPSPGSGAVPVDRRRIRLSGRRAEVVLAPSGRGRGAQAERRVRLVRRSGHWLIDRLDEGCKGRAGSPPDPVRRAPHRTGPGDPRGGVVHPEPGCSVALPPGAERPSPAQLRELCAPDR